MPSGCEHGPEGRVERDTGDDARQGDRQHDQERDGPPAEEAVRCTAKASERAEDQGDGGGAEARPHRGPQRVAGARAVPGRGSTMRR